MENIRYGKLDATDEEVIAAAKLANADTFIHQLPDGYNTLLTGDGANLSQGQRQLLAIARAAIADPPVLILDEATSSIDTRTEKIVQDGMDKLMAGRTTFVIAHRLSTVKNSDCIIVLEQGRVIERGNHDKLMEEKGKYYQLYTGNLAEWLTFCMKTGIYKAKTLYMPVLVSILGQTHKHSIILNESVSSTAERYAPAGVLSRFLPRNRSYLHSIRSSLPCILAERYLMETYDILSYPSLSRSNPGYHGCILTRLFCMMKSMPFM